MKNNIEFKHFRKFENFPKLDFNDITFVVGKNNSGKSTFVKAFVMVYNYLKSGNLKHLDLNQGSVELLNIVTFDRALCKTMTNREDKNYIPISVKLDHYEFFLNVTGEKNSTILDVLNFKIIDNSTFFTIEIEPQKEHAIISYSYKEIIANDTLIGALQHKNELEKTLESINDQLSKESIDIKNQIEKLSKNIESLHSSKKEKETSFTVESDYMGDDFQQLFADIFKELEVKYWRENPNMQLIEKNLDNINNEVNDLEIELDSDLVLEETNEDVFNDLRYYYINRNKFNFFSEKFISFIKESKIFYLPATLNKQSALLSIRDKNNDLAEVVHKYFQLGLQDNPIILAFIKEWIIKFEIGTDLKIELINGEAYSVQLKENEVWIPLADKGMGSIQAVLLILRLASVIYYKEQKNKNSNFDFFIIVEEPELNLHPALQSKLCDLFFQVYVKNKIKFIIETHSEYIIRKTQLLVKENDFEIAPNENPFAVLYFNDDLKVWNMNYRQDGRFSNEFGTGFFDESSNLAFELM